MSYARSRAERGTPFASTLDQNLPGSRVCTRTVESCRARQFNLLGQRQRWYHMFMEKTTVYLPSELKSAIRRVARRRGLSEAEVIRDSIRRAVGDERPRPHGGLFASGAPIARQADDHLKGFGER